LASGNPTSLAGVLLAGGRSRRMGGGDKCLALLGGRPLLAHAIARFGPQVDAMAINANGDLVRFAGFGLPVIADPIPGFAGPLAGILAGMQWARAEPFAAERIVTVATDTPFFPDDLVARLVASAAEGIAVARTGGRLHRVFGVFPVDYADDLEHFIKTSGSLKVGDWLDRLGYVAVDFDDQTRDGFDPFFNINRPDDLNIAEAMLAAS
jgi:molybdenum cofactor guanylyltransferase